MAQKLLDDEEELTPEEQERQRRLAALTAPTRLAPVGGGHSDLELAESIDRTHPHVTASSKEPEAPDVGRLSPVGETPDVGRLSPVGETSEPTRLKPLSFHERQRLPVISPDAPAGSAASEEKIIARYEDQKENPWGSPENHPGRLGRIGHVLSKIGNIAGDVVAPNRMAIIPGTDLHREMQEDEAKTRLGQAQNRESEGRLRNAQSENLLSEVEARQTPKPGTPDEQALAARQRILAVPEGQKPDPKDEATWKAYADLEGAKQGAKGTDETKQPIGDTGATQHGKQLDTLTAGMSADEKKAFMDAYTANAKDTHAIAAKRFEYAKAAAQLTGGERDRALQRQIAARNREDTKETKETQRGEESVYAYDPKNNQRLLTTRKEAQQNGHTNLMPAKAGDEAKEESLVRPMNDVQMNLSRYRKAYEAIPANISHEAGSAITRILSDASLNGMLSNGASLGALMDQISQGEKAAAWNKLSPAEQDLVTGYIRSKSSIVAYQRALTGSARANKETLDLEMANIPSPIVGMTVAKKQLDAFQENIDKASEGLVKLPWLPSAKETRESIEGKPKAQPEEKKHGGGIKIIRDANGRITGIE